MRVKFSQTALDQMKTEGSIILNNSNEETVADLNQ